MMALTLHEPWATLIALGHKTIETRSWPTRYRGPIAIHAGKTTTYAVPDYWAELWSLVLVNGEKAPPMPQPWPFGQIIAVADLVACERTEAMRPSLKDDRFGNFSPGRWGWRLANVRRLEPGVAARGFQMLWQVPDEVVAEIRRRA